MTPADNRLAEALASAEIKLPRLPVYSNVDAAPHLHDADMIRATLVAQVISGVRWEDSMKRMLADGFDTFYEIGPGRGPHRPAQEDRPQDALHEHPGAVTRPSQGWKCRVAAVPGVCASSAHET